MSSDLLPLLDTLDGLHAEALQSPLDYDLDVFDEGGELEACLHDEHVHFLATAGTEVINDTTSVSTTAAGATRTAKTMRWLGAVHNAYPRLAEALRTLTAERDEARTEVARLLSFTTPTVEEARAAAVIAMTAAQHARMGDSPLSKATIAAVDTFKAAMDGLRREVAGLQAELATLKNQCGRVWYHPHAQEDKVCRLPRGHAPVVGGCEGEAGE